MRKNNHQFVATAIAGRSPVVSYCKLSKYLPTKITANISQHQLIYHFTTLIV